MDLPTLVTTPMCKLLPCEEWYPDPAKLWGMMGKTRPHAQAALGKAQEPLEQKAVREENVTI